MEWTAHPLKADQKKSMLLISIILLISLLVLLTANSVGFALVALTLLVFSTRQFFMPTVYNLNSEGVEVRFLGTTKKRHWGYFSSYYEDRNGILLSPFNDRSRLEAFRGVYLIITGLPDSGGTVVNKEQVRNFIKHHISGC